MDFGIIIAALRSGSSNVLGDKPKALSNFHEYFDCERELCCERGNAECLFWKLLLNNVLLSAVCVFITESPSNFNIFSSVSSFD